MYTYLHKALLRLHGIFDPIYLAFHDPSLVSSQDFSRGSPFHSQNLTAFFVAIVASGEKSSMLSEVL